MSTLSTCQDTDINVFYVWSPPSRGLRPVANAAGAGLSQHQTIIHITPILLCLPPACVTELFYSSHDDWTFIFHVTKSHSLLSSLLHHLLKYFCRSSVTSLTSSKNKQQHKPENKETVVFLIKWLSYLPAKTALYN